MRFNKRFKKLNISDHINDIICVAIIGALIGGRFVEVVSEPNLYPHWYSWFALWQGGLSALGGILGAVLVTPFYLKKIKVPIFPLLDVAAIYAPLFQAIARLGCFFAGCCHGIPTDSIFSVIYTNPETIAQLNTAVHPTQLYSSALFIGIFLYLFFIAQHKNKKPGLLFTHYLALISLERFIVDFWRNDRIFLFTSWLSFHQIVALLIFIGALFLSDILSKKYKSH